MNKDQETNKVNTYNPKQSNVDKLLLYLAKLKIK